MNYTTDIRGDLIFNGFEPVPGAPESHDEHGLDLLSGNARDIAPAGAPNLNLEQIASPEDGWMDPAPEAAHSLAVEPNIGLTPKEACYTGPRTRIRLQDQVRALPNPPKLVGLR